MRFFSIFEKRPNPNNDVAFANAKKVIEVIDSVGDWGEIKDLVVEGAPFTCQADAIASVKTIKEWVSKYSVFYNLEYISQYVDS